MKIRLSRRAHVFVLAGALVVFAAGVAKAITSTDFTYSQPQTGFLQLPPAMFSASRSDAEWERDTASVWPTTANSTCFLAPVTLPDNARMTRLTFWYTRADATFYSVQLIRTRTSNAVTDLLANASPGSAPNRTAFSVVTATGPFGSSTTAIQLCAVRVHEYDAQHVGRARIHTPTKRRR